MSLLFPCGVVVTGDRRRSIPTVPPSLRREPMGGDAVATWLRRCGVALLLIMLTAGMLGTFGQRVSVTAREAGGLRMEVAVTTTTRSGLPQHLTARISAVEGALPSSVEIRLPRSWLELLDQHAITPAPDQEWVQDEQTVWTFERADGAQELVVALDARIQVDAWGVQRGWLEVATPTALGPRIRWTTLIWP